MISFQENLAYDLWANSRILEWTLSNEPSEKIRKLLSHISNAQHIWTHRIMKKETVHGVWEIHNNEKLNDLLIENVKYLEFVHKNYQTEENIQYRNSKGADHENTVGDILFHVFNHGNYHRAQINTLWREQNVEPPFVGFIQWKREQVE